MTLTTTLTLLAALGAALMAGTFFAFSNFVMGALGRLPAHEGVAAMQSINIVVINPMFLAAFMGTGLVCLLLAIVALFNWTETGSALLIAGALVYMVGCIGVTMMFNVPLNNALAPLKPDSAEAAELWRRYLSEWTMWNTVRTIAPLASVAMFFMGRA